MINKIKLEMILSQKEADNQERHELAEQAAAEAIKDGFDSNKPKTPPA